MNLINLVSRLAESTSVTTLASTHVLHNHCAGFDFSVSINSKIYQIYSSILSKMADSEAILISDDEAADRRPNSPLSSGCSLFQLSCRPFLLQPCFQLSKSLQGFRPRFTILPQLIPSSQFSQCARIWTLEWSSCNRDASKQYA